MQPAATATPRATSAAATPTPVAEATPFLITNATKWKTVEEFDYQWNPNQPQTHFKLEIPEGYSDPGDFIRIRIQAKDHPEFVLNNEDGWIEYSPNKKVSGVYGKLKEQSLVQSKYVLVLPASKNPDDPPLIFLRSWDYASNPERLHIIGLQRSGDPLLLFNNEFALVDVSDVDGDGTAEIIGYPCLSEATGEDSGENAGTYHPYQVYKVESPIQKVAALSVPLTEQYTRQKYDGWAGPECRDDYVIVWSKEKNKKPVVLSWKEFMKRANSKSPAR